jgi:hypothetical protein
MKTEDASTAQRMKSLSLIVKINFSGLLKLIKFKKSYVTRCNSFNILNQQLFYARPCGMRRVVLIFSFFKMSLPNKC